MPPIPTVLQEAWWGKVPCLFVYFVCVASSLTSKHSINICSKWIKNGLFGTLLILSPKTIWILLSYKIIVSRIFTNQHVPIYLKDWSFYSCLLCLCNDSISAPLWSALFDLENLQPRSGVHHTGAAVIFLRANSAYHISLLKFFRAYLFPSVKSITLTVRTIFR